MKTTKYFLLIFMVFFTVSSCKSLLEDNESEFSCDKNAPIILNDKQICAGATSKVEAGEFKIRFGYATGSFNLVINVKNFKEGVNYTYAKGEISLWFNNLNKTNSGILLITKLDETNRKMSGQFNFNAESNNNSQAFDYILGGKFTDVSY